MILIEGHQALALERRQYLAQFAGLEGARAAHRRKDRLDFFFFDENLRTGIDEVALLGAFVVEQPETEEDNRFLRRHSAVIERGRADIARITPAVVENEPEAKAREQVLEIILIADDAVEVAGAPMIAARAIEATR